VRLSAAEAAFESRPLEENAAFLVARIKKAYDLKIQHENPDAVEDLERYILLNAIDRLWQEHLYSMDGLREGVYLRAHGQKDPLVEYKNEAFVMFGELMQNIKFEALNNLFRSTTNLQQFERFLQSLPQQLSSAGNEPPPVMARGSRPPADGQMAVRMGGPADAPADAPPADEGPKLRLPLKRSLPQVGRNDACPCGSGKKFKSCCGRTA